MALDAPKRSDSISSSRVGEGSPLNLDHRPGLVEVRALPFGLASIRFWTAVPLYRARA